MHEDASLACDICSKSFSRKSLLNLHLRMHKGLKTFKCSQCEKRFKQRSHLNTRMDMHTGVRRFSCEQCDKLFFSHSLHIWIHTRRCMHNPNMPFQCKECDKTFKSSAGLTYHTRTHTGEKRFFMQSMSKSLFTSSWTQNSPGHSHEHKA